MGIGDLSNVTVRKFGEGIMEMSKDPTRLRNNLMTRLLFSANILESTDLKNAIPAYFDVSILSS